MPVERGKGRGNREPGAGRTEYQPAPYYLAATFKTREDAEQPYQRSQEIIFEPTNDLDMSAFRFERQRRDPKQPPLARPWYVVVIGEQPPDLIHQQLLETLRAGETGELTSLPLETIVTLSRRRSEESQKGSWVEAHHEPGLPIPEATLKLRRKKEKGKRKMQKQSRRRNRGR